MASQARLFRMPLRYLQGPGVLERVGAVACAHGTRVGVVTDEAVGALYGAGVDAAIRTAGGQVRTETLAGDVTVGAVSKIAQKLEPFGPETIVGLGGGKALDAAKGVAAERGLPFISAPTSASNDSPTSACYALYNEDHTLAGVRLLPENPVAVIVDTEIIAKAPPATLRSGIGDALAKKFEAEACAAGQGVTPFETRPLLTSRAIADLAYATLRADAAQALADNAAGRVSEALENVIEANLLMSGLGFENGGLSLAHALTRGLGQLEGVRSAPHGLQIAWCLLIHLRVAGYQDDFLADLAEFYGQIGLPRTLQELGGRAPDSATANALAHAAFTAPHVKNFPAGTTPARVAEAILAHERP
ncbi:MAG: iron-containing alcohol dehydrogenase [Pseudomonadota bacterium]